MTTSYREIYELARRLPVDTQIELAEELLHNVRAQLRPSPDTPVPHSKLSPLSGLSEAELAALAEAVITPQRQEKLRALLQENQSGSIPVENQAVLDELVDEVDQIALLKARALYTLQLRRSIIDSPE